MNIDVEKMKGTGKVPDWLNFRQSNKRLMIKRLQKLKGLNFKGWASAAVCKQDSAYLALKHIQQLNHVIYVNCHASCP